MTQLCTATDVEVWTALAGKNPADLNGFDLLLIGGGNTFRLLDHLRAHDFIAPTRHWVREGGCYYGGSAGAVLATDSITVASLADSNDVGLGDHTALGLVPGITLLPHYTASQEDLAHAISHLLSQPVIAVPEAAGLVIEKGHILAVGPQAVWVVTGGQAIRYSPGSLLTIPA